MTREVKFRGKRVDNGEWVYGNYFIDDRDIEDGFIWQDIPQIQQRYGYHYQYYDVDPDTVGQYTGLCDKNDKEIYEGDVLKSIALSDDHHQRGATIVSPVKYWCGNACLSITYVPIYPFCVNHELEVIGNIYDNPDLLAATSASE